MSKPPKTAEDSRTANSPPYLCKNPEIRLYSKNVIIELTPALIALNRSINGISPFTTSVGTPINSGVIVRFAKYITTTHAAVPAASAIIASFFVFLCL